MEEERFSTKDLYLSAALIASGAKYDGVNKDEPRHMEFYFLSNGIDLDEIHTGWVNGDLQINAVNFKNAIQQMKSIVHSSF